MLGDSAKRGGVLFWGPSTRQCWYFGSISYEMPLILGNPHVFHQLKERMHCELKEHAEGPTSVLSAPVLPL